MSLGARRHLSTFFLVSACVVPIWLMVFAGAADPVSSPTPAAAEVPRQQLVTDVEMRRYVGELKMWLMGVFGMVLCGAVGVGMKVATWVTTMESSDRAIFDLISSIQKEQARQQSEITKNRVDIRKLLAGQKVLAEMRSAVPLLRRIADELGVEE